MWIDPVEWKSKRKQLLSRDPPWSLLSTGKLVSSIRNDWRHETRGLLCACPCFFFLSLFPRRTPLALPQADVCPTHPSHHPKPATDYWLSSVKQPSPRQLLHFKLEKNTHLGVYSLTGHTWLRQEVKMSEEALCRWITDYSREQMSSWRAVPTAAKPPEGLS